MSLFSPKYQSTGPDVILDINTTPLIDVMLVLLIMLIITIPLQLNSVNLDLPPPSAARPQVPPKVTKLAIERDGGYVWDGVHLADASELQHRMQQMAADPNAPTLHVSPEGGAPYRFVATALAAAQREGLHKLGIVSKRLESQ